MQPLAPGDPESIGHYRLEGRLGTGGMGLVYAARSPGGRKVAVKVIRPEYAAAPGYLARFAREVEAARKVGGFHTAQVLDADAEANPPWMATAYIDGPTLLELVRTDGPLTADRCVSLAMELAEGLAAIHACDLVHRDLKPGNIIIAADGARIIDFGVAKAVGASSLTHDGQAIGTYAYMSPEQIRARPVGSASDIFSLGALLYFAATGHGPFDADNIPAIDYLIANSEPDLSMLAEPLRKVIAACLKKDPDQRPPASRVLRMLDGDDADDGNETAAESASAPAVRAAAESAEPVEIPQPAIHAGATDLRPVAAKRRPPAARTRKALRRTGDVIGAAGALIALFALLPGLDLARATYNGVTRSFSATGHGTAWPFLLAALLTIAAAAVGFRKTSLAALGAVLLGVAAILMLDVGIQYVTSAIGPTDSAGYGPSVQRFPLVYLLFAASCAVPIGGLLAYVGAPRIRYE